MSYNKVLLLGNVGKDPEVRTGQSGKFATFTLATTDRSNVERYTTEIYVENLELVGAKPEQTQAPNPNPPFYNQERSQIPAPGTYADPNTLF